MMKLEEITVELEAIFTDENGVEHVIRTAQTIDGVTWGALQYTAAALQESYGIAAKSFMEAVDAHS